MMKSLRFTLIAWMLLVGTVFVWADKVDKAVNIKVGNKTRKYRLYVPKDVKENTALVFCLHGTGGSSDNKQPSFDAIANKEGIIVVYGHGETFYFPVFGMNAPGWHSTGEWSEDIDYIKAIIEDVAANYSIDRKRIYCCGFSNGGMMTYTVANLLGDVFAAFASISGYPINEFHLHHTGARPVPFLHIHGKNDNFVKYSLVPKIINNMVARNGSNPVPTVETVSGKYKKSVYEAGEGGFPIVFYEVDGMGHEPATSNTEDGNASKTMWNFMSQYTLDSPCDPTLKWRPRIEQEGWNPKRYGWTLNSGTTICSFGKNQDTGTNGNANVYPSLQFIKGDYRLTFNAIGEAGKKVTVELRHLAGDKSVVFTKTVEVGQNLIIDFSITDDWAEFNITFSKADEADDIQITGIEIHSTNTEGIQPIQGRTVTQAEGIYNMSGVRTNELTKGINIVKTRDGMSRKVYQ
ncbi:MAG: prolyl oligopeptidase family serine peptidase [Prevotella sp.]|nr:prolyl oligopeptidase family serine peptidase [Prevotella sp.]